MKDQTLADARRNLGLNQSELAQAVGMTQPAISLLENGRVKPHPSTRKRLEAALNCILKFNDNEV